MTDSAVVDRRIERSRRAILAGATVVFLRHGFEASSVDDVAREAGVTKRTVYNIFGDKEALFRATVFAAIEIAERFSADLAAETGRMRDASRDIPRVARRLASAVLRGPVLPLRRLLVSEAQRFPDLATEYRRRAPEAVILALSAALRDLADAGQLDLRDPDIAAEHFAFLIMGADLDRGMFDTAPIPQARLRARADAGAAAFLRAYGTAQNQGSARGLILADPLDADDDMESMRTTTWSSCNRRPCACASAPPAPAETR